MKTEETFFFFSAPKCIHRTNVIDLLLRELCESGQQLPQIFHKYYVITVQTVGGGTNQTWADGADEYMLYNSQRVFTILNLFHWSTVVAEHFAKSCLFLWGVTTVSVKWNSCKSYSSTFGCVEVRRYVLWLAVHSGETEQVPSFLFCFWVFTESMPRTVKHQCTAHPEF